MSQAIDPSAKLIQPKWMTVTGWVLTVLVTLALLASAGFKFTIPLKVGDYEALQKQIESQGFSVQAMTIIGVVEAACALIYLFPRTSVLGAALINGYLGGAILVHVLGKEPIWAPLIFGVVAWLGIFLREPRLRSIMPWRM
jgi:hypothetical protein